MEAYEQTLRNLLALENSPYDTVKGVPELVDTSFAFAHAYFGDKLFAQKEYRKALREYGFAAKRLEMSATAH